MNYLDKKTIVLSIEIIVTTDDKKEKKMHNPEYATWMAQDQQALSYLLNSLSKEIIGHVAKGTYKIIM
jgi:hypothetical protein